MKTKPMQQALADRTARPAASITLDEQQLEIGFERTGTRPLGARPSDGRTRARWWFNRMRHVVNHALDWTPAPPPRPEQIRLALTR